MERIEDHKCTKKGTNADIFNRYYNHDKVGHVHYCHYCGEEVTESEYVRNLESRLQDSLSLINTQRKEIERLKESTTQFVDKYFSGSSKANREDYGTMVISADIYKLREALKQE